MSSNLDQLQLANRILSLLFIFIISSTLALSPVISSPLFYSQKGPSVAFLEIDKQEDPLSKISTQADSFSAFLPLIPNVAYGQSDSPSDPPSASFPLIAALATSCSPSNPPPPPGTQQADTIYGTDNGETIDGLGGADQLFGCGGADTINGGGGADSIDGGDGNDNIDGGNQNDNIIGGEGNDNINGGEGQDNIDGGIGNDILNGGEGKDTLVGGDGDDTLIGGNGGESLTGGNGADTFNCGHAKDTVEDYDPSENDILIDCENADIEDAIPPVVTVPNDITTEATSSAGAVVTFTATAIDAVDGSITPTCAPTSGSTFPLGTTTVTCSATDNAGNTGSADFDVIVVDTTAPVIDQLDNIVEEANTLGGRVVTFTATASDIVDGPLTPTCVPASGFLFPVGTTTVSCDVSDNEGNAATTMTFTVTITDTTAPVIDQLDNIVEEANTLGGRVVTFTATASDIVDGPLTPTCVPASGFLFPVGTTTVSCDVSDNEGNAATTMTFTVTITDTTAPVIDQLDNIVEEANTLGGRVVTFTATASDIVDGPLTPTCVPASGFLFPVGTTTVSCDVSDNEGNAATTMTFTVTITDTTAPVIDQLDNIVEEANTLGGRVVTFTATASDIVDGPLTPTCVPASGFLFPVGTTTVSCDVSDNEGNAATTMTFTVTITDTTAPVIDQLDNIVEEANTLGGRVVTFTATASDIVDGPLTPTCVPASGFLFPVGTTTVSCDVSDNEGNAATTMTFTVTITDTTAPVIDQLDNIVEEANTLGGRVVTFTATASDIVDGPLTPTCVPASGFLFPVGTTTVSCDVSDNEGNAATTMTFTVTITDTTAPVIDQLDNIVEEANTLGGRVVTFTATASDIVDGPLTPTCVPASGFLFPVGTTTVSCDVSDNEGNAATTMTFTVTITDTTAPVIDQLDNIVEEANTLGGRVVTFTATASDIVDGPLTPTCVPASGFLFPVGTTTVSCDVSDNEGNAATTMTFTVTITDTTAPVIDQLDNIVEEANTLGGRVVTFTATASDIVDGPLTPTCVPASGFLFPVGTTTVSCDVSDNEGNAATTMTFTVTITDTTAPVIDQLDNIVEEANTLGGRVVTFTATASDIVDGPLTPTCVPASGFLFPVGTTTVSCDVSDNEGNAATTMTFTVTITDTTAPVIDQLDNIVEEANTLGGRVVTFTATASDIVDGPLTPTCVPASGFLFPVGTTTVSCDVSDNEGNAATTMTFTVTITDTTAPVIDQLDNIVEEANTLGGRVVTFTATASDIVDGPLTPTCVPASGFLFPVGTTTVSCDVSDNEGNAATTMTFTVTITDTTAPVIDQLDNIVEEANTLGGRVVTFTATASDIVDGPLTPTCVPASGFLFPVGTTTVSCDVSDNEGNAATTMTFTVTITDTTAPVIDQLDNIVEEANTLGGRVVTFTATASDIVDGPLTPTCVPASGFLFPVGTTTVSCDVSDNEGNAATTMTFTVTITDTTAPVIDQLDNIVEEANTLGGRVVTFTATASDIVDGPLTPTCVPASGFLFPVGTTTVSCDVSDNEGNAATTMTFTVTITDTTAPVIDQLDNIVEEANTLGGRVVTFTATASDIVDGPLTPTCVPASGFLFPVGTTTVSCDVSDNEGNAATTMTFTVTITDTTAPVIDQLDNIVEEANTLGGRVVTFTATASDIVDGPLTPTCVPASGFLFPVGTTTVSCDVSDNEGNAATTMTFTVTITDTTAPETTITSAKVPSTEPNNDIGDGDTTTFDSIVFTFLATDSGSGVNHIICELTGPTSFPAEECTSPKSYTGLADGTYTFLVKATDNAGNDPADSFTWTISTPEPPAAPAPDEPAPDEPAPDEPAPDEPAPDEPAPAAPAPAAPAPDQGITVQFIERQIFQRPYAALNCTESLVELRKDLIPTTDFPALVNETESTYDVTVLNVYNVPDYKAMLLAEGDERKVIQDTRFVLAAATCGEMILELVANLVPTTDIFNVADDAVSTYHVKVVDVVNMTGYKAIVILAEPNNPITKDQRFVQYGEDYQSASNHTGGGELDLSSGHIAAPAPTIKEETIPDSIKRTFSTTDLKGDQQDTDVDIAILDTGIDLDHPDLNVYKNVSFVRDAETGDDDNGHGTHVAGIAAAKDDGKGIVGGAPGARLWSVKVCSGDGECKISDMIKGVEYITQHADEIDVVNISVETPLSPALNRAVSASIKAGVTYVVAAGNYGHDASTTSPASNPDAITVSAIADSDGKCGGSGPQLQVENATDDTFAQFSNFGPSVSIAAPGVAILSTYLDGGYAVDSGTSMASPSVAAAAALIKANSTDFTPKQVKDSILNSGSTPLTPCEGGPQGYFSGDPDEYKEPLLFRQLNNK